MSEPVALIRVLVVEDTLSLRKIYSHVLTRAGYTVLEADSGAGAKQMMLAHAPEIVLLDRVLPDMDGSDICAWIKASLEFGDAYVIIVSALKTSEEDRVSGLEAGADDYLVKPVSKRELLARVRVAARLKSTQLALRASEAKHRSLAENSPDIIMRLDTAGRPIYINPRVQDLLGVDPTDILGLDRWLSHTDALLADRWYARCADVTRTGEPQQLDFAVPAAGQLRYLDARLVPEFDAGGQVHSILAVLRDYTDHIRSELMITRMAAIAEQTTDAVIMVDPQGLVQFMNAAFARMAGTTRAEVGQSIAELCTVEEGLGAEINHALQTQGTWQGLTFLTRGDGSWCDVEGSILPILDRQGKVTSWAAILRDVTERRRAEREREVILTVASSLRRETTRAGTLLVVLNQLHTLLNVAGAAVATVDAASGATVCEQSIGAGAGMMEGYLLAHPALTRAVMEGGQPSLLEKVDVAEGMPTQGHAQIQALFAAPISLPQRQFGVLWMASADPIPDHVMGVMMAIADITASTLHRIALFAELEQYAAGLEQRVVERTSELAEANHRLLELDRLKTKFVSNVSHELRTPISNLKLYMSLLQRGKAEKRTHYEAMLQLSVERLGRLVEDILNLSRLEIAHYQPRELEPTDLNAVINQIVTLHQPQAEAAGLQLVFEADPNLPLVYGDINQLAQLVTNLVVNSLHYTRQGGVKVCTCCPNGREKVTLTVADTGVGIMPDDLPHVFDRFYRGNHRQPVEIPGTGLGLSIVKEIVDIHHGDIQLESQVDVGTRVDVTLPTRPQA